MKNIVHFPLDQEVRLKINSSLKKLPHHLEKEVQDLWEKRTEKFLIDRPVISLLRYSPKVLIGQFVPFRMLYAVQKSPALRSLLDLHPLGISGRTLFQSLVLIGKRSEKLSSFPKAFECCPSGHLDGTFLEKGYLDFKKALLKELEEESKIPHTFVQSIQVHSLYWSLDDGVWDIHCDLFVKDPYEVHPSLEYSELFWSSFPEAKKIFQKESSVPLSNELIKMGS